jgi:hypothetical protein
VYGWSMNGGFAGPQLADVAAREQVSCILGRRRIPRPADCGALQRVLDLKPEVLKYDTMDQATRDAYHARATAGGNS